MPYHQRACRESGPTAHNEEIERTQPAACGAWPHCETLREPGIHRCGGAVPGPGDGGPAIVCGLKTTGAVACRTEEEVLETKQGHRMGDADRLQELYSTPTMAENARRTNWSCLGPGVVE